MTSPTSSPLRKMHQLINDQNKNSNDKSLSFINLPPLFTGFTRTFKSISNYANEDFLMETDNEISIITSTMITSLQPNEVKLTLKGKK